MCGYVPPILRDVMNTTTTEIKIKKGHLYFNTRLARVERITGVTGSTVEHRHHAENGVSPAVEFRLATAEEVKAYLGR